MDGGHRSADALALARENAERCGLAARVAFAESDWFAAVTDAYVDRDARKPGKAGSTPPSDHAPVVIDADL